MKTIVAILFAAILFTSCNRSITMDQAANGRTRGARSVR